MNFLAHLYLAEPGDAWVGALVPDLVRGRLPADQPEPVRAAVRQHRAVDAFTDAHTIVQRTKRRLRPAHGRWAGILTDVFFDHFLAVRWRQYHDQSLAAFAERVYHTLTSRTALMPAGMRAPVRRMVEQRWLTAYAHRPGIALTLKRMSRRFSDRLGVAVDLVDAMKVLDREYMPMQREFAQFFPCLVRYTQCWDQTSTGAAAAGA